MPSVDEVRDRYRDRYLASLARRLTELDVLGGALDSSDRLAGDDEAVASQVRRHAHQLRGTGASFGFPAISELGAEVEDCAPEALTEALGRLQTELRRVTEVGPAVTPAAPSATVLLVEDDATLAALLQNRLGRAGTVTHTAPSVRVAVERLRDAPVDLVLLDLLLPDGDGRDVLRELRALPGRPPEVIVLSARLSTAVRHECLTMGVTHFVAKPVDLELLEATVHALLARRADLDAVLHRDPLTGLPNRQGLVERYTMLRALPSTTAEPMAVAMIDLDHFKAVNDRFGHAAGDEVLRTVAARVGARLRDGDLLARWGGEEFALVLPQATAADASVVLEGCLSSVRHSPVPVTGGDSVTATFSAGVAEVVPGESLDDVLDRADRNLLAAKRAGRNRVVHEAPSGDAAHVLVIEDDPDAAALIGDVRGLDGIRGGPRWHG